MRTRGAMARVLAAAAALLAAAEVRPIATEAAAPPPTATKSELHVLGSEQVGTGTRSGASVAFSPAQPLTLLTGSGPGQPALVSSTSDDLRSSFVPYPGFTGGVTVATCTTRAAGVPDTYVLTGAGPGGGPHVRLFKNGEPLGGGFFAYEPQFRGGVDVACADLDGDGEDEIVTGAGPGGGPVVRVFDLRGTLLASFFAYDQAFVGGVRVDATTKGIVTGPGPGGGPNVRTFDTPLHGLTSSTFCFEPAYAGGVDVSVGDVDADGHDDIACGGLTGAQRLAFLAREGAQPNPTLEPFTASLAATGGANVAATRGALLVGVGVGGPSIERLFLGIADPTAPRIIGSEFERTSLARADGSAAASTIVPYAAFGAVWLPGAARRFAFIDFDGGRYGVDPGVSTAAYDGTDVQIIAKNAAEPLVASSSAPFVAFAERNEPFVDAMRTDGTGRVRVAFALWKYNAPGLAVDPAGKRVVVTTGDVQERSPLSITRTDRAEQVELTNPPAGAHDSWPAFSPDGLRVAYCRGEELRSIGVDGAGDASIVAKGGCRSPQFSPDGTKIAYAQTGATVVVPSGGGTTVTLGPAGGPSWEPNGARVAFGEFGNALLNVVNADGTGLRQIGVGQVAAWEPARR